MVAKASSPAASHRLNPARLLGSSLGTKLLGADIRADVYVRNGFRFVALPACADDDDLERGLQLLHRRCRRGPEHVAGASIGTGYDAWLPMDVREVEAHAAELRHPYHRMRNELFWPHVTGGAFEAIARDRVLASAAAAEALARIAAGNGRDGAIARHALAVMSHNRAITAEIEHLAGRAAWTNQHWADALAHWADVLEADAFWDYLCERAGAFDDLLLLPADIDEARKSLPAVLLGWHGLLARSYADAGNTPACYQHLLLVHKSRLPGQAKQQVLLETVRLLTKSRLAPVVARVTCAFAAGKDKIARPQFDRIVAPALDEAAAVRRFLKADLHLSDDFVKMTEFDPFAEAVWQAIEKRLDYKNTGGSNSRTFLYSIVTTRRLLGLPLSDTNRRRLEQSIRSDAAILYRNYELPDDVDPSMCWFLGGEVADPDASVGINVYRITNFENGQYSWESRELMIPRSRLAADLHAGRARPADIAARAGDPVSLQIKARIAELRRRAEADLKPLKTAIQKVADDEEARAAAERKQLDEQSAAQEAADRRRVESVERQRAQHQQTIEQRTQAVLAPIEAAHAQPIAEARARVDAVEARYRGLRGAHRIELPIAGGAAAVLGGAATAVGIVGLYPSPDLAWIVPAAAAGVAALVGMLISRGIRSGRKADARKMLAAAEAAAETAKAPALERRQAALQKLQAQTHAAVAEAQARLTALEQRRAAIAQAAQGRIQAARHDIRERAKAIRAAADGQIHGLEAQLAQRVQPKPESGKRQFPALQKALAGEYSKGSQPSEHEAMLWAIKHGRRIG